MAMSKEQQYAYIDESGTVGAGDGSHFLVVAATCTDQPHRLVIPVRRALRKFGPSLRAGEIKASDFREDAMVRFLQEIARQDIEIIAVITDQRGITHLPKEKEIIYRQVVTQTIYHLVKRHPSVEIILDRRYTSKNLRYLLEKHIRQGLRDLPQEFVLIRQENSVVRKELQAVDAVAWAFFKKYERNEDQFYILISKKIVVEELIVQKDWSI
jgi:transcriptional/translational regulatory protein YebC/TACO1